MWWSTASLKPFYRQVIRGKLLTVCRGFLYHFKIGLLVSLHICVLSALFRFCLMWPAGGSMVTTLWSSWPSWSTTGNTRCVHITTQNDACFVELKGFISGGEVTEMYINQCLCARPLYWSSPQSSQTLLYDSVVYYRMYRCANSFQFCVQGKHGHRR